MTIIKGIYETHLEVRDVKKAMRFYQEKLGLKMARYEDHRKRAFFLFGEEEESMISIVEKEEITIRHFAFRVHVDDIHQMIPFLQNQGIEIIPGWENAPIHEPIVYPWNATACVYFNDIDGNRLEFVCNLPEPPQPDIEKVMMPLSEWNERCTGNTRA